MTLTYNGLSSIYFTYGQKYYVLNYSGDCITVIDNQNQEHYLSNQFKERNFTKKECINYFRVTDKRNEMIYYFKEPSDVADYIYMHITSNHEVAFSAQKWCEKADNKETYYNYDDSFVIDCIEI